MGNGLLLFITHVGDCYIQNIINLSDVLVVRGLLKIYYL